MSFLLTKSRRDVSFGERVNVDIPASVGSVKVSSLDSTWSLVLGQRTLGQLRVKVDNLLCSCRGGTGRLSLASIRHIICPIVEVCEVSTSDGIPGRYAKRRTTALGVAIFGGMRPASDLRIADGYMMDEGEEW